MAFILNTHIQIATMYPRERVLHKTRQQRHQEEKFANYLAVGLGRVYFFEPGSGFGPYFLARFGSGKK